MLSSVYRAMLLSFDKDNAMLLSPANTAMVLSCLHPLDPAVLLAHVIRHRIVDDVVKYTCITKYLNRGIRRDGVGIVDQCSKVLLSCRLLSYRGYSINTTQYCHRGIRRHGVVGVERS